MVWPCNLASMALVMAVLFFVKANPQWLSIVGSLDLDLDLKKSYIFRDHAGFFKMASIFVSIFRQR